VATGQLPVFYTRQFQNTTPILFQLKHIFPYIAGLPLFIFSILGIFFVKKNFRHLLIILIPSLIYFIYNSLLYVKWTRFMSPIFFLIPLFASYFISQFKNKTFFLTLIVISILPGILFFTMYLQPDIRLTASDWASRNLIADSVVFSEAGNVINFPFHSQDLHVNNFDFYNLDSDPELINQLPQLISQSDYIIIPSRRIFKNQTNSDFPHSYRYYQSLFSGQLGFQPLKTFSPNYDFLLNAENAEETWSVFDHPTLRIYQNVSHLSVQEIHQVLSLPNEKN
jgi:hypothetical protein